MDLKITTLNIRKYGPNKGRTGHVKSFKIGAQDLGIEYLCIYVQEEIENQTFYRS